jgi:membrane-associated phospholipid phosphatase
VKKDSGQKLSECFQSSWPLGEKFSDRQVFLSDRKEKASRLVPFAFAFVALIGAACTGCGTMRTGSAWGENAIYPVAWRRIPEAAKNAALNPITWMPLLSAGVIAGGGWDHDISNWATEETPLFGSNGAARNYSDIGRNILRAEGLATALLTPSGDDTGKWLWNKTRGIGIEAGTLGLTSVITGGLKDGFGRERPDESDRKSMPSGHASSSFAAMALTNRNLDHIEMNQYARTGLQATNMVIASSVAWARVEGERHFPTDVLVGAALGNFTARFVHDAFIGTRLADRLSFYIQPGISSGTMMVSWEF